MAERTCEVADCDRPAESGGRCFGHRKQSQRTGHTRPLRERHATPWDRLVEAAIAYADAVTEEEFAQARDRLRKAAIAYVRSIAAGMLLRRRKRCPPRGEGQLPLFDG